MQDLNDPSVQEVIDAYLQSGDFNFMAIDCDRNYNINVSIYAEKLEFFERNIFLNFKDTLLGKELKNLICFFNFYNLDFHVKN